MCIKDLPILINSEWIIRGT